MKWLKAEEVKPISNVSVHIVTASGVRSVARYWKATDLWLINDKNLNRYDPVVKWKYEEAS